MRRKRTWQYARVLGRFHGGLSSERGEGRAVEREAFERWKQMTDPSLKVTRGDATMLYATSHGSYTVRFHLRLDQKRE